MVTLLEDSKRRRTAPTLCEEQQLCCCMCRHNYESCHRTERRSSGELQSKENISNKEKPVRRRKVGLSNLNLDKGCLSEREEPAEEQSRSSLKSGQSLDNNNYVRNSLKIETDGCNFLSPGYGYDDGDSYLSRHSSTYGISDNCPSPNPSTGSSEDSYQSRHNVHHNAQNMLLPNHGTVPLYSNSCRSGEDTGYHDDQIPSDGMRPLYSNHSPDHGTFLEIPIHDFTPPQHELYGRQNLYDDSFTPPQFGASDNSYLGMSSSVGHLSHIVGDESGSGHDHHSTDFSAATLPSSSLHKTNQLSGERIPGQSPLDSDYNHSTVIVPPPSSTSSQCGDHSNSINHLSQHGIPKLYVPPSYNLGEDLFLPDYDANNPSYDSKMLEDGGQLDNDNIPDQKAFSEERSVLETEARFQKSSLGKPSSPEQTMCVKEDLTSDVGSMESLGDKSLSQAHRDSCLTQGQRISDDKDQDEFSVALHRKNSGGHLHQVSPKSSRSEESDTNMVDRLRDVIITPGMCDVQETRM